MLVPKTNSPSKLRLGSVKLALAFAAIYLVWGSTYLAIRYAVETIPPLHVFRDGRTNSGADRAAPDRFVPAGEDCSGAPQRDKQKERRFFEAYYLQSGDGHTSTLSCVNGYEAAHWVGLLFNQAASRRDEPVSCPTAGRTALWE